MTAGTKVYTKRLLWCEVGGTSLHEKYGVYKGYMGRATTVVLGFNSDEIECWHCKKTIMFGDLVATNSFENFCTDCVTPEEPAPQFTTEKTELGYAKT